MSASTSSTPVGPAALDSAAFAALVDDIAATARRTGFTGAFSIHHSAVPNPAVPLHAAAYGDAHRAHAIANTTQTRFAIASGSKTFTALAAMRLVEQGVLTLDAPIRALLGEDLPLIDDRVTLEHLLTHTSGIGDYLDEADDWSVTDYVLTEPVHRLDATEAFLPMLEGHPQDAAPGERFSYNNAGFVVAALVIQRATGAGFHELVERLVLRPAGLANTAYLRLDELPAGTALGYLHADGDRTNALHLPVRGNGDGGAFTTLDDLAQFWVALTSGAIVTPATLALMATPRNDVPDEGKRYGLGLWLHATGPALYIEGYDAGVSMQSGHHPGMGVTATVLGNWSDAAWPLAEKLGSVVEGLGA